MTVSIRAAVPDAVLDIAAMAEIRIRSWQAAYRGIVPQDYLDGLRPADEVARLRRVNRPPESRVRNFLADADGRPVGWAAIGPYREADPVPSPGPTASEVYAIYLLPEVWGRGYGRVLMERLVAELAATGYGPVLLWVLTGNDRACDFYRRMGFRADGAEHRFEVAGVVLPEVRYRLAGT